MTPLFDHRASPGSSPQLTGWADVITRYDSIAPSDLPAIIAADRERQGFCVLDREPGAMAGIPFLSSVKSDGQGGYVADVAGRQDAIRYWKPLADAGGQFFGLPEPQVPYNPWMFSPQAWREIYERDLELHREVFAPRCTHLFPCLYAWHDLATAEGWQNWMAGWCELLRIARRDFPRAEILPYLAPAYCPDWDTTPSHLADTYIGDEITVRMLDAIRPFCRRFVIFANGIPWADPRVESFVAIVKRAA